MSDMLLAAAQAMHEDYKGLDLISVAVFREPDSKVAEGDVMESNKDSQPSPNEPGMFRFVEVGMRLSYELEPIGQIRTSFGHTIEFCPVLTSRGWSTHKEFIASLRLIHRADQSREIGRCLVDQDEVVAWGRLLRQLRDNCCSDGLQTRKFEYETRHGIRIVWQSGICVPFLLHVSSPQPAILPNDFIGQLLTIFDEFEILCDKIHSI